ncbi:SAM-dependent methyltransferase [bacterium]|nr:SAM-dependent methyltransferase [bacterium]
MHWLEPMDWSKKPFTYKYSQPEEYRYSLDSIEFIWRLSKHLHATNNKRDLRVLDLCAGCGVLGFELNHWTGESIKSIDFVEVQQEFKRHFQENLIITGNEKREFVLHLCNFKLLPQLTEFKKKFDLIVCNPPYFRPETGSLSQSGFRNRCHFLVEADFESLCDAILTSLAPNGEAYVLLRDLRAQGIDQTNELKFKSGNEFEVVELGRIRGTPVVRVKKQP